jgi:hypothetical protein
MASPPRPEVKVRPGVTLTQGLRPHDARAIKYTVRLERKEALPMSAEVSVRLTERVWREFVDYAPSQPTPGLPAAIRSQLQAGVSLTEEKPARLDFRITTLSLEQANELERWLIAVAARPHAPVGIGVALTAVREAIRLAAV